MKKTLVILFLVAILSMISAQAIAETVLASSPLPPGDNGYQCACTNLSKNRIEVRFLFVTYNGANQFTRTIDSGNVQWVTFNTAQTRNCRISRSDGKSAKTRDLACTFSAIDAYGNPTAVVQVDRKFKR